jgi:hypothetical protein
MKIDSVDGVRSDTEKVMEVGWTRRFTAADLAALAIVLLVGAVHLPIPFHDDQVLFTIAGWKMDHGALLYRDFWDIKQPGIFVFYWIGGKLFGFNEVGIHEFELLYMLLMSMILICTLKKYFDHVWASAVAVLLTSAFYYGVSGIPHRTLDYLAQVEGLVGFPLYVCLWTTYRGLDDDKHFRKFLFASGVAGGIVLFLKLMFLPILLAWWIAAVGYQRSRSGRSIAKCLFSCAPPVSLGVLIPIVGTWTYFASRGGLQPFYYTMFTWPTQVIGKLPLAGPGRMYAGLQFFVTGFAPMLALGFAGAARPFRKGWDFFTAGLLIWIFAGLLVIFAQVRSWWPLHYMLLIVPLGILATRGVETMWDLLQNSYPLRNVSNQRLILTAVLLLLFSPVLTPVLANTLLLARYKFGLNAENRLAFQCRYPDNQYLASSEFSLVTDPGSIPGPIYVGGSLLYYYLSGRQPAVALSTGGTDFLPAQWEILIKELNQERPPYIFISDAYEAFYKANYPEMLRFLGQHYRLAQKTALGSWYILTEHENRASHEKDGLLRAPSRGCQAQAMDSVL